MPSPFKSKDDLWAEFQQKSGASRRLLSGKTLVAVLVVVLMVIAAFAFG